jgi:hypothetical protein
MSREENVTRIFVQPARHFLRATFSFLAFPPTHPPNPPLPHPHPPANHPHSHVLHFWTPNFTLFQFSEKIGARQIKHATFKFFSGARHLMCATFSNKSRREICATFPTYKVRVYDLRKEIELYVIKKTNILIIKLKPWLLQQNYQFTDQYSQKFEVVTIMKSSTQSCLKFL